MPDRCCHHCQDVLDALDDLRVSRLMHAMRPYLPSSPLPAPRRDLRGAPTRIVALWPQPLAVRIPAQRTKTAAAREDRLNLLPHYRPRTDINNNRGF